MVGGSLDNRIMGLSRLYAIVTNCNFIRTFEIADEFEWPLPETVSSHAMLKRISFLALWLNRKQHVLEEKKHKHQHTYLIVNRCVEEEWKGCLLQSLLVVYQHKCFVCCKPWFFAIQSFGVPAATINAGNLMDHLNEGFAQWLVIEMLGIYSSLRTWPVNSRLCGLENQHVLVKSY